MNLLLLAVVGAVAQSGTANAKTTLYQCAVDRVEGRGVRVNVIENNGAIRANLIFGTTVSGTIYQVEKTDLGYAGEIKNKPAFKLELTITSEPDRNSNIDGYKSYLRATYPTLNNGRGYDKLEASLVCGEKFSDRWN